MPPDVPSGIVNRIDFLSIGFAAFFGCLVGAVLGGLNQSKIAIKIAPNQGIRTSVRRGLFPGFVLGFLLGLLGSFLENMYTVLKGHEFRPYATYDWVYYFTTALMFGCTLFLWFNGFDVVKHYTLRLILALNRIIPLRIMHFFDCATDKILLHKVGGGYSFIHRYLMEHFAGMSPGKNSK
jgi:hypothetical protein